MSSVPAPHAIAYHHASDLPVEFWAALRQNELAANIILPYAIKAQDFPRDDCRDQLWIIVYDGDAGKNVEFVLSCTMWSLGNYPIFIYTPKSPAQLAQEEYRMADFLLQLVLCLLDEVPPQRVFSVFSLASVAEKFAEIFVEHVPQEHGIQALKVPYYDATLTFCTKVTLNKSSATFAPLPASEDFTIALRHAGLEHLEGVAALCKGFSYTSPPYKLDDERAKLEARALITNKAAWVHMIKKGDEEWEFACLIATTRESRNVTAVTKVFVPEKWRGRGCAARLLHRVCQEIIKNNKTAVLYVGNSDELVPARKVYNKVGFQGLRVNAQSEQRVENVETWLEIGFTGTTLGYW